MLPRHELVPDADLGHRFDQDQSESTDLTRGGGNLQRRRHGFRKAPWCWLRVTNKIGWRQNEVALLLQVPKRLQAGRELPAPPEIHEPK